MNSLPLKDIIKVSATQLEGWDRCNRYWWFKWGWSEKLQEPDKGFLTFGTCLHGVIERWLKADALGRGDELYPVGWDASISKGEALLIVDLVKTAIDEGVLVRLPDIEIEVAINRPILETDTLQVIFTGKIDVLKRNGIEDHKSTKNFRYAKTPDELRKNTQMLCYAMEALQRIYERGEPMPNQIELRHNVYSKDPENKKVKVTKAYVTPSEVFQHWNSVLENIIPNMLEVRKIKAWQEVPGPENMHEACNAFGGCAFQGICTKRETVDMYRRRTNKQPTKATVPMSSLLDKMRAKNNAQKVVPPASDETPTINTPPPSSALAPKGSPFTPNLRRGIPNAAAAAAVKEMPSSEPEEVEAQEPPPWAVPSCKACEGVGFSSTGDPCRICDSLRKQSQGITSSMFDLTSTEEGVVWTAKPAMMETLVGLGWTPSDEEIASYQPEAAQEETKIEEVEAPVVEAPQLIKRGPGRPRKQDKEVSVTGTDTGTVIKSSFVLMLGCKARKQKVKTIYIEEVVASVGMEIAQQSDLKSYYDADVWRRRDALAGAAPVIASRIQGSVLLVPRLTTDNEPLVDALCALASEVFEADGFRKEK